jgi:hypothetical protein
MDFNTLSKFRCEVYACFKQASDALMNVADALLTETPAQSLAELSLSPFFERRWPSLYEALQDAKIDRNALQEVFARHAPLPDAGSWFWEGTPVPFCERSHRPRATALTYMPPICPKAPSRSDRDGSTPSWRCCPQRKVVGSMFWITSA